MAKFRTAVYNTVYAKLAAFLICIITLSWIFIVGKEVLAPLVFSFFLAIFLLPLTKFFEKKFKLSAAAAAALSIVLVALLLSFVVFMLGEQITGFARQWPSFRKAYSTAFASLESWLNAAFHLDAAHQSAIVNAESSNLASSTPFIISETILSLSSGLLYLFFILIYTFFILFYRKLMLKFLAAFFKEEKIILVKDVVLQTQYIIRRYIAALVVEMIVVAAASCIAFSLIGIRYAILLGVLTGILNVIPYFGIFASLVLTLLVAIGTAASGTTIFLLAFAVFIIHLLDGNVLKPFLIGSRVKINAFATLLGVVVGQMIWGISGMLLAIPVIALCKIIFDRVEALKPWGILLGDDRH